MGNKIFVAESVAGLSHGEKLERLVGLVRDRGFELYEREDERFEIFVPAVAPVDSPNGKVVFGFRLKSTLGSLVVFPVHAPASVLDFQGCEVQAYGLERIWLMGPSPDEDGRYISARGAGQPGLKFRHTEFWGEYEVKMRAILRRVIRRPELCSERWAGIWRELEAQVGVAA